MKFKILVLSFLLIGTCYASDELEKITFQIQQLAAGKFKEIKLSKDPTKRDQIRYDFHRKKAKIVGQIKDKSTIKKGQIFNMLTKDQKKTLYSDDDNLPMVFSDEESLESMLK